MADKNTMAPKVETRPIQVFIDNNDKEHSNERDCVISNMKDFVEKVIGSHLIDSDDVVEFLIREKTTIKDFYKAY